MGAFLFCILLDMGGGAAEAGQGTSQICIRSVSVYPAIATYPTRRAAEASADGFGLDEWSGSFTLDQWANGFTLEEWAGLDFIPDETVPGIHLMVYAAVDCDPAVAPAVAGAVTVGCSCN